MAMSSCGGGVMHPELIASMRDQVCTIYRAVTGTDMPTVEAADGEPEPALEEVTRSFAELEAMARTNLALSERVPPFSFTPRLDVFLDGEDLLIEAAVPGVDRKDVTVECAEGTIVISGIRRGHRGSNGRAYSGEIPPWSVLSGVARSVCDERRGHGDSRSWPAARESEGFV